MSVRPITQGEETQADGGAMAKWLMIMGSTQGLLMHLRFHNLTIQSKWASSPLQRLTLLAGIVGGAAVGASVGSYFYGDAQLRRLSSEHAKDRAYQIESQLFTSYGQR
jgi:hypothetical protein